MTNIYYLTRSYLPMKTGGALARAGIVKILKASGFNVSVITPGYGKKTPEIKNEVTYIPLSYNTKFAHLLEMLGLWEDYLDKWVEVAFRYLEGKIKSADLLLATSGGELGCIKLGSLLKEKSGAKLVIDLQDPIDYTLVQGRRIDNRFHVSREKCEEKYLKNADLVVVSSTVNRDSLKEKYPFLSNKIFSYYYGYINKINQLPNKKSSDKLRIVYGGSFSEVQQPEILAEVAVYLDEVEIYFLGNYESYKPIRKFWKQFHFLPTMPLVEYQKFVTENIDAGFVSLANEYLGACVPAKLYEYINLGIPILGALPEGDARDIINKYGYGIAVDIRDRNGLRKAIEDLKNFELYKKFRDNILRDRDSWAMEERIKEFIKWLKNL